MKESKRPSEKKQKLVLSKTRTSLVNDARLKLKERPDQFLDWNKAIKTIRHTL